MRKHPKTHLSKTASDKLEEGGDHVKSARPLWAGLHAYYNGNYNKKQKRKLEQISKRSRSSDCCLQFDNMKLESLVIADQHAAVNTYLSLVHTACHAPEINFAGCFQNNKAVQVFPCSKMKFEDIKLVSLSFENYRKVFD